MHGHCTASDTRSQQCTYRAASIRKQSKWMGHKDLNTTMQYLDWLDIHGKEAGLAANKTFRV